MSEKEQEGSVNLLSPTPLFISEIKDSDNIDDE